eukprot:8475840-Prorocentrum_lima.AAC.1
MTSSLVGSEMCIRDRLTPKGRPSHPKHHILQKRFTDSDCCATPCYEPVSYTHLTLPTICSV